jgi:hypothetical protein
MRQNRGLPEGCRQELAARSKASRLQARALLFFCALCFATPLQAQLPFYTDDTEVTEKGTLHFEFFDEFDVLQRNQFPNLRQNTANYKLNVGLPHNFELDLDAPYLAIFRAIGTETSTGVGDTNLGVKWKFRQASQDSRVPAMAVTLYIEFPTGNTRKQLGSGLTDYWLNFIMQKPLTDKTRINTNIGFLFAGNTSTGVVGIQTTRGHVYTGGISLLHDLNPRLTLGCEIITGIADSQGLGRSQIQGLLGAQYAIRKNLGLDFALLGGTNIASPRIGGQVGFSVDFPGFLHTLARRQ